MTKKKPQIRFAGFDEEWERRKLGEVCISFDYGLNVASKEFDGINKYIRITDIDDETRKFLMTDLTSPNCDIKLVDNYKLQKGDIVFARTGASVGKTYIYKENDGIVYYAGFLIKAKVKNDIYSKFIFYITLTKQYEKFIDITSQRSGQPGVNAQEYAQFEFFIPLHKEQKKIGEYFENLDKLITLHQNKYDKLTNIKKSMLEKMFPKNGSNIPEIRFKGFSGDWKWHKLEEVVDIYDGVHQTPEYKDSGIMFLSVENITTLKSKKYISEEAFKKNYKVYPQKGDILMTRIGDVGTPNVVETTEKLAFYVSLALLKPNKVESYFLCNIIQSPLFQKGLKNRTLITAIPQKINKYEIGKVEVILSNSLQEQQYIGKYFYNLDKIITLHRCKLEKLKNIKKACMEKMFV
ncbi:restriction endonuclease subunit S [Lachnospiraceae bacterium 46-61]